MKIKKSILLDFISFFLFSIAAVYITYPLIFHMGVMATGLGDELLIAWIQNWVINALSTGNIFSIFDANIYYPYHNTLAYSETFITSSMLALPIKLFTTEPIATVNFTLISSLILLGFSLFILAFYLTKDFLASLISGIIVIFSPAVLSYYIHLQVLAVQWTPLSILFFLVFIKKQRSKYLVLSLLFFVLQIYNSFLPGYFIIFSFLIILIYSWLYKKKQTQKLINKRNLTLIIIFGLLVLPIIVPYYRVSKEFGYVRDIRESIHNALQFEDILYSSGFSRLSNYLNFLPFNMISQNNEFKPGYLGFIFTILVLYSLWFYSKNYKKRNLFLNSFFTISTVSFILSLGPFLHFARRTVHNPFPIPLPYALFYYILPGFKGFISPARWEMLFILGMSMVIALMLHKILEKKSLKMKYIIYSFLIAGIIIEFKPPINFVEIRQIKEFPKVYAWLTTTPSDTKIIEMPIYTWNMQPYVFTDNMREYYSTIHFRKIVNGASGFSPPPWQEMVIEIMKDFPQETSITKFKKMGLNYIVINKKQYDLLFKDKYKVDNSAIKNGNEIISAISKNKELHFIKKFDNDYVYKIN